MGEKSMAWVYMYNNNDNPAEVYYRSDEKRCKFLKDFMFGMVGEEYKEVLLNMCEFDFTKRVLWFDISFFFHADGDKTRDVFFLFFFFFFLLITFDNQTKFIK